MKHQTIVMLLIALTFLKAKATKPLEIISKVKSNYEKHQSITCSISYKMKYLGDKDTTLLRMKCKQYRNNNDSLFWGNIWVKSSDSLERYYDYDNFYVVNHPKQEITLFSNPIQNQTISSFTGHLISEAVNIYFLKIDKLFAAVKDTNNKILFDSTDSNFIITISYPEDDGIKNKQRVVYIDKKTFNITKMTFMAELDLDTQYNEWNIENISYDDVNIGAINSQILSYKNTYLFKVIDTLTYKFPSLLSLGNQAPMFSGIHFQIGKKFDFKPSKNKYTLLEFGYMSCQPCINAIPDLNIIFKTVKDIDVYSINTIDNSDKGKTLLPKFIRKYDIQYPVILAADEVAERYQINGFPTIYIIDKKGNIIYAQDGLVKDFKQILKDIIAKNP